MTWCGSLLEQAQNPLFISLLSIDCHMIRRTCSQTLSLYMKDRNQDHLYLLAALLMVIICFWDHLLVMKVRIIMDVANILVLSTLDQKWIAIRLGYRVSTLHFKKIPPPLGITWLIDVNTWVLCGKRWYNDVRQFKLSENKEEWGGLDVLTTLVAYV